MLNSEQRAFLAPYFRKHKVALILGFVFVAISTALEQVAPWVLGVVIDTLGRGGGLSDVMPWLLFMVVSTLVGGVLLYWQRYLLIGASRKAEYELRNDLFALLQEQPQAFHARNRVGDLLSRCTSDLDNVRELIGPVVLHTGRMGLLFVYTAIAMFMLSPTLAVVGLSMALLLPILSLRFMKVLYETHRRNQTFLGRLNAMTQETFTGMSVIKGYGVEERMEEKLVQASDEFRKTSKRAALLTSSIWPVIALVSGLGLCMTIAVGLWLAQKDQVSAGTLAAIVLYLVKVHFPLVGLGWVLSVLQKGKASLERILSLVRDAKSSQEEPARLVKNPPLESLVLRDVSVSWGGKPVLTGLNLELRPGRRIGLVGPIGAGKTSAVLGLCALAESWEGRIEVNGIPVEDQMAWQDYRRYFSLAPQDGFLFSDSIRNNIRFGAQEGEVALDPLEAAHQAGLEPDLKGFPDGLETLLGERGINLSGGQRQRVGLARALCAGSAVLILDDTLSALDAETESKVLANLKSHLSPEQGRMAVIVGHRYSSVRDCDEILYLEDGCVLERGSHEALVELGGRYAAAWNLQIVEEAADE